MNPFLLRPTYSSYTTHYSCILNSICHNNPWWWWWWWFKKNQCTCGAERGKKSSLMSCQTQTHPSSCSWMVFVFLQYQTRAFLLNLTMILWCGPRMERNITWVILFPAPHHHQIVIVPAKCTRNKWWRKGTSTGWRVKCVCVCVGRLMWDLAVTCMHVWVCRNSFWPVSRAEKRSSRHLTSVLYHVR